MTLDWNSEGLILIPCSISDPHDFGQVFPCLMAQFPYMEDRDSDTYLLV